MLPDLTSGVQPLASAKNPGLSEWSQAVLGHIDIFCATPSAMDEALVPVPNRDCAPREIVQEAITNIGFRSFHNYVATDAQLASEILDELAADGIELTNTGNHLALIYEWDTFYGRMLSLTYSAELASRQARGKTSRSDFVQAQMAGNMSIPMPTNFHPFVYLRGLDGQTVKSTQDTGNGSDQNAGTDKQHPSSFEEIRNWTPDANKSEGPAQFDYLSRLGNQLQELQRDLKRSGRGKLRAIGIVGSDVYDTLLILQALHSQSFDRVVFFTTDLDARFLDPRENDWTRDLLVVSSYGLALHPDLQSGVASFRESAQTAQFAATLAALGNTQLAQLKFISPRRFEIGKQASIDWSTNAASSKAFSLHPFTRTQIDHLYPNNLFWRTVGIGLSILILLCFLWNPLRRVSFRGIDFCCEALHYTKEDIGTLKRAASLLEKIRPSLRAAPGEVQEEFEQLNHRFKKESEEDMLILLAFLNYLLEKEIAVSSKDGHWVYKPQKKARSFSAKLRAWLASAWAASTRFKARGQIDVELNRLSKPGPVRDEPTTLQDELRAAKDARRCAREIFCLRCWLIGFYWATALLFAVLGCRLGWLAWRDTFQLPRGEPFSLTNGVSAWPGEILRFLVVVFAVWFAFGLYYRMRETYFMMTRKFRLRMQTQSNVSLSQLFRDLFAVFLYHEVPTAPEGVPISTLWSAHSHNGRLWRRLLRIVLPLALLWAVEKHFFAPEIVRGPTLRFWDPFLVRASGLGFLVVALLTIDSALISRRFILALSSGPTDYNKATRALFSRGNDADPDCLEDWIDVQLVTELTEQVGKLVYYPTILLVLLLLARNGWWENWSWPPWYIFSFVCGLLLSLASVWILQNTAKQSKRQAEKNLERKAALARAREEPPPSKASQAEKLLDQLQHLKRGAFVPFWQNPVVTAFFASSGGITALQIGIWLLGR
jgi:hypothetical protein